MQKACFIYYYLITDKLYAYIFSILVVFIFPRPFYIDDIYYTTDLVTVFIGDIKTKFIHPIKKCFGPIRIARELCYIITFRQVNSLKANVPY